MTEGADFAEDRCDGGADFVVGTDVGGVVGEKDVETAGSGTDRISFRSSSGSVGGEEEGFLEAEGFADAAFQQVALDGALKNLFGHGDQDPDLVR